MSRMLTAILLCSIVMAAPPARASASVCPPGTVQTHFQLVPINTAGPLGCQWVLGVNPQLLMVEVRLFTTPVGKVRFSLPDPPFGTFQGESWNFPFTGDRVNGMEMTLGCTGAGTVTLGTLFVLLGPGENVPCTEWRVDADCEADDCSGNAVLTTVSPSTFTSVADPFTCNTCFQYCENLPPFNLYPPDGATSVPLNVELSWEGPIFNSPDPALECGIAIYTDAGCSGGQGFLVPCDAPRIVLSLLPSTTYYWRASWRIMFGSGCSSGTGDAGVSEVHSFTTEGPIAHEPITWGRVKAMYRD